MTSEHEPSFEAAQPEAGPTEPFDKGGQGDVAPDVIALLRRDHETAERLLGLFESPVGSRPDWFDSVRETLVRHEVAEELIVYPAVRHHAPPGRDVVEERLAEQAEAVTLLTAIEETALGSDDFRTQFLGLRTAVLDHARAEERTIFPALETRSASDRRVLGQRYERAKDAAPSHPHPHLPQRPPGNVVLGPVAALADRLRDAARNTDDQSQDAPLP